MPKHIYTVNKMHVNNLDCIFIPHKLLIDMLKGTNDNVLFSLK